MDSIFTNNLNAIKKNRPKLYKKIKSIESNRKFEVFVSNENINILDIKENIVFYKSPKDEIEKYIKEYEKYREYPFLYLFGIDNGKVVESLLRNKNHKQIVVIEPDLELIYIVFNLIDFSKDLEANRLLVLEAQEVSYNLLIDLIHVSNAKYYIRVFEFLINSHYSYTVYQEKYTELFKLWLKVLDYIAQANGNDINDTFRGVKQHFENLDLMLQYPKYQDLLKKKSAETAVIVSTGPSLDKQLPLLKKYQDKICILSVDASFPILVNHGIKPDFVFSMERDEPTSIFFKEVSKEQQEGVIFVCASLQHTSIFKSIKTDSMLIVMRPFSYNVYLELHDYGYLCKGMSSANMAHEFATAFGFKQLTFIGQDLAFGKDYKTHSNGHVVKEKNALLDAQIREKKLIEVDGYGKKEKVLSNIYWIMFKNFIEHHIASTIGVTTAYNSTEGGVYIEGSIEISFRKFLEQFASQVKDKIVLDYPSKKNIQEAQDKAHKKIRGILEDTKALKANIDKTFLMVADKTKVLEHLSEEEALKALNMNDTIYLLEHISKIRKDIENSEIYLKFLSGIIQPLMYSMELEIAEIKVRYIDNAKENQKKALQWILAHRFWLFSFSGVLENIIYLLDKE